MLTYLMCNEDTGERVMISFPADNMPSFDRAIGIMQTKLKTGELANGTWSLKVRVSPDNG